MNPHRREEHQRLLALLQVEKAWSAAYPGYLRYVTSMAEGERNEAFHVHLRSFVASALQWPLSERIAFVDGLCRLVDRLDPTPRSSPFPGMPAPLLKELVCPTLDEWVAGGESIASAHLWLAVLPLDRYDPINPDGHLATARRLAPHDALVIKHEVLWLLWSIEWDCHHLPQALLATPDAVLRQLRELEDRLSLLPEDRRAHASEQTRYLREILQAYLDGRKGKAATRT